MCERQLLVAEDRVSPSVRPFLWGQRNIRAQGVPEGGRPHGVRGGATEPAAGSPHRPAPPLPLPASLLKEPSGHFRWVWAGSDNFSTTCASF